MLPLTAENGRPSPRSMYETTAAKRAVHTLHALQPLFAGPNQQDEYKVVLMALSQVLDAS